jgi:hypothetical protein
VDRRDHENWGVHRRGRVWKVSQPWDLVVRPASVLVRLLGVSSHQSWGESVRGFLPAHSNPFGDRNPVDDRTRTEARPIVYLQRHVRRENCDRFARDYVRPGGVVASFDSRHESDLGVRGQNSFRGEVELDLLLASRGNHLDRTATTLGNSSLGSSDLGQRSCLASAMEHGQKLAHGNLGHDRQSCEASYLGETVVARLAHAVREPRACLRNERVAGGLGLGLKSDLVGRYGWNCCEPKADHPGFDHCGHCEPKVDLPDLDYHGNYAPKAALQDHDGDRPGMDHVLDVRERLDLLASGDPP